MTDVFLAVDLGGTKVEAALVDANGVIRSHSRRRASTGPGRSHEHIEEAVVSVVAATAAALRPGEVLMGAGIGAAGPVHRKSGTISPLNLAVSHFPIARIVADTIPLPVPVLLALDGQCIALAEATFGAARTVPSSVSMVVSTGVGGGIVIDGRVVPGDRGNAGHIGQLRVTDSPSDDPRLGTLEEMASGPAAVAWARQQGWTGRTGEELAGDAGAGVAIARAAIVRSANTVGSALAGLSAVLDIDLFVIGGGFSNAAPDYTELVQTSARRLAILPASHDIRVRRAALGNDAPLVGAACLVISGG